MPCGITATLAHMSTVAARDLRNHTSEVLRRVAEGEPVIITQRGEPVAELRPLRHTKRATLTRAEVTRLWSSQVPDPALATDLEWIAGGTDELGDL